MLVRCHVKLKQSLFIASVVAAAVTYAACDSTSTGPAPVPVANPTAVPIPALSFAAVSSTSAAAAGVSSLPAGAPVGGSIDFGTGVSIPPGTVVTTTLTSTAPTGIPTLSALLHKTLAKRSTEAANGAIAVLAYVDLLFSNAVTFAQQPSFTMSFPAADVTTANYYLAAYDPTRPSLGWQLGFEGPGTKLNATTIVFTGASAPFTFAQNATYYFAPYAISTTAVAPTPAPSISPVAPVTAAPTTSPTVTPSATPTASGPTPTPAPSIAPSKGPSPTPAPTVAPSIHP